MSIPDSTAQIPPQSPKRLCEINFTTIAEDAENLQMSPKKLNRREKIRLEWLKLISSSQKIQQMQTTFNFLRYAKIDSELTKFRTKLIIRRWHQQLLRKKWQKLRNGLNRELYLDNFNDRAKRICEVRAKQASEFLITQEFIEPNYGSIIQAATNINAVTNLQGKFLNSLREQRENEKEEEEEEVIIEREVLNVPLESSASKNSRKWHIAFVVSAIVGILIGLVLFWKKNEKVIAFLRKSKEQNK